MKKQTILLLIALLSATPLLAQYSPCYEAAFAEGKRLFEDKKYSEAKKYFNEAKDCPDPNIDSVNEWIKNCKIALDEAGRKAEEARRKAEEERWKAEQERLDAERKALEEAEAAYLKIQQE